MKVMQFNTKNTKDIVRIYFYEDGTIEKEVYFESEEVYDVNDKQSYIYGVYEGQDKNGENLFGKTLYDDSDIMHRPTKKGPARIEYYPGGKGAIKRKAYLLKGKIHKPIEEGPAVVDYY